VKILGGEDICQIVILDILIKRRDAKAFFNSSYKVKMKKLLEEILEYLDYHRLFYGKAGPIA